MAGTVETDITTFTGSITSTASNCDNATITDWSGGSLALDTESKIQGTGCYSDKVSATTLTFIYSCNSVNMGSAACIFVWMMCITPSLDTRANGGLRIGVGDGTNTGDWYVGGSDFYAGGWQCFCAHTGRAYDTQSGTPNLAAITRIRVTFKTTASSAKDNCFIDCMRWGTYLRVKGGTSGSPATFQDLLDYDLTNSLGVFSTSSGIVFSQIPLQIGSTITSEDTYFKDITGPIILFKAAAVKSDWYEIKLQGGTNTTEIYLGETVGGQGVNGPIIKTQQTTVNKNFLATSCYSYNANTSAYTDETADANNITVNDVALPPIQVSTVGDAIYFGDSGMFGRVRVQIGTAGVYSGITMQWQYYNGSGWAALTGVVDGTAVSGYPFKAAAGTYNVDFTIPFWNWATYAVNSITRYWIRCVVTAHNTPVRTTGPLATQIFQSLPYTPFKITASDTTIDNYGFFGCAIYNASTITLQAYNAAKQFIGNILSSCAEMIANTAIVQSCNFVSSAYRALRISSVNHYVTACNFINCQTSIHHNVGGAFGSHAHYNYDTLMFYGSTYDIENSAVASDYYIDIDRLNGSNPNNAKINNSASGSTTILAISVTLKVTVKDIDTGLVMQGARVLVWVADDTNFAYQDSVTITSSGTTATVSHTAHGMTGGDNVIISGASPDTYNGAYTITYISVDSYSYTMGASATSPATGTITSTQALINTTTDEFGVASDSRNYPVADQPILGWVRKATTGTLYKQQPINETMDYVAGLSITVQLISDM